MLEETYSLALWDSPRRTPHEMRISAETSIHDKAVGHLYESDTSALPPLGRDLGTYGHWSSVASTLYNKLYKLSQFDPSMIGYSAASFANLQHSFSTSPFWNGQFSITSRTVAIRDQDYKSVVEVLGYFSQSMGFDQNINRSLIGNIRKIAQLASNPNGPLQKQSMCCNATIAITAEALHIILLYTVVSLEMDPDKGRYRVVTQDIKTVLGHGLLDFDFCNRHANSILGYDTQSVDAWEDQAAANSQPENTSPGWPPDA